MANRLMEILQTDKNALKKFSGVTSKEDALKVAQKLMPDYTEAELIKDIQDIQESSAKEGSLSSAQLDSVVGGAFNWGGFFTSMVPTLLTAGPAIFGAWNANRNQGNP